MDPVGARRLLTVWAIPAVVLLVIAAPPLVLIGRLPDPLAVHWSAGGSPDGSMGFWASLAGLGGFWLIAWIGLLASGRGGVPSSPALAVVYFVAGILAAVQIAIVDRNLNAPGWESAGRIEWWGAALVVAAGLVAGAAGWILGGGAGFPGSGAVAGEVPSAGLADDEEARWVGTAAAWWPVVPAVAVLAAIPFIPAVWRWAPVVPAALVGWLGAVTVTVDRSGLVVGYGWFGWPRRHIALDQIERAEVVDVEPAAWGGWGYRIRPGVSALILRRGPAIRVVRRTGRDMVVTVDDPARGAGIVNDLLRRGGRLVEE